MTTLISLTDFEPYSDVPDYTDEQYVKPYILEAQAKYLRLALQQDLYNRMLAGKKNNSLTYAELDLLELIKPVLVYRTGQVSVPFLHVSHTEAGYRVRTSENSRPATEEEQGRLVTRFNELADLYTQDLIAFLQQNIDDYPLFDIGKIQKPSENIILLGEKGRNRLSEIEGLDDGINIHWYGAQ